MHKPQRPLVDPFGMFDCSLNTNGAGAVVVTSLERAKSQKPVLIKGFATHNNTKGWIEDDHMLITGARKSGERAYTMAGLGPRDVDTAQIYDCFTYMVLTQLEDYCFCAKGKGGAYVRSGALRMGGHCRPTPPAGSCPRRMSRACCRSSRGQGSSRAATAPADRCRTPRSHS